MLTIKAGLKIFPFCRFLIPFRDFPEAHFGPRMQEISALIAQIEVCIFKITILAPRKNSFIAATILLFFNVYSNLNQLHYRATTEL